MDTDAEGRLILADTLTLASRKVEVPGVNSMTSSESSSSSSPGVMNKVEPALILDFATLTGTAITALSSRYVSLFTNRESFLPLFLESGRRSGEKAWPFPLDPEMNEDLQTSTMADLLQVSRFQTGISRTDSQVIR